MGVICVFLLTVQRLYADNGIEGKAFFKKSNGNTRGCDFYNPGGLGNSLNLPFSHAEHLWRSCFLSYSKAIWDHFSQDRTVFSCPLQWVLASEFRLPAWRMA